MKNILTALLELQSSAIVAETTRRNGATNSRYANLNDIIAAVQPELTRLGLVVTQQVGAMRSEGDIHAVGLVTTVWHAESGEHLREVGEFPLAPPPKSNRGQEILNYSQTFGLSLTYARRYTLLSALGITTGDDKDAQRLSAAMETVNGPGEDYSAPDHWTNWTGGKWKAVEAPDKEGPLGELPEATLKSLTGAMWKTFPPIQARIADEVCALLEASGDTYEETPNLPESLGPWGAWADLTPAQLRGLRLHLGTLKTA